MTGGVKFEFAAATYDEAVQGATERFRLLLGDPRAMLPWSTHFEFSEQTNPVNDERTMMVTVRIEFDDKTS
jgi:hypothetical protein